MASDVIEMEKNKHGVYVPKRRPPVGLWALGGIAAAGAIAAGAYLWRSRPEDAEADDPPASDDASSASESVTTGGITWTNVRPLPKPADVPSFDLTANWGKTPGDLRPLFALMEVVSGIEGSARIFAIISKREAGFVASAHNASKQEVAASRRAYENAKERNQPLTHGAASAEFGSGGLFGALAPYFLWTGIVEIKDRAPLLSSRPEIMFLPRVAAFGAVVYLQQVLSKHRIDDHADIKVGWARPSLLRSGRGGSTYQAVRARFFEDAEALGVDLEDSSTIPAKLVVKDWPGVTSVFEQLVGELPTPIGG